MTRLTKAFILTILFLGATTGCGGQVDTGGSTTSSSPIVFQFTATIDSYADDVAPFPAAVGDVITGTFTYNPNVATKSALTGVQVKIGSTTLNADLRAPYLIQAKNDSHLLTPDGLDPTPRDVFLWLVKDTSVAAQYGLDNIQVNFYLDDLTATALTDSQLPSDLNLNNFSTHILILNKEINGVGTFGFGHAQITSLHRMQ